MALARKEDSDRAIAYVLQLAAEHGQTEAARTFGFSQAYVSRLSRGEVARLRAVTVEQITRTVEGACTSRRSTRTNLERDRLVALVRSSVERKGGQVAAAAFLGVSQSHVSRLAQGEAPEAFQRRTLEAIAHALNFPPEAFAADASIPVAEWVEHVLDGVSASPPPEPAPSAYDLVRRMDARELRAFRAWVLAWTDEGPDAA